MGTEDLPYPKVLTVSETIHVESSVCVFQSSSKIHKFCTCFFLYLSLSLSLALSLSLSLSLYMYI